MDNTEHWEAVPSPDTPEDFFRMVEHFRYCQRYIQSLPKGNDRESLEVIERLANDFICELYREHGLEDFEDWIAFENGDFSKWTTTN